jgi:hypothetical protein
MAAIQKRWPDFEVAADRNHLVCWGRLQPAEYTDTYDVVLEHTRGRRPLVYVARPKLQLHDGEPLPHVFAQNTICLTPESGYEQSLKPLAHTVLPWASEWLYYYELWVLTGRWSGGGVHPGAQESNRLARRSASIDPDERRQRLASALVKAFPNADLEELLFNARL